MPELCPIAKIRAALDELEAYIRDQPDNGYVLGAIGIIASGDLVVQLGSARKASEPWSPEIEAIVMEGLIGAFDTSQRELIATARGEAYSPRLVT